MSGTIEDALKDVEAGKVAPFYLVWGEEFLARHGADELVKRLVPDLQVGLNFCVLDGASPREVADELATMPLFPGRKVVLLRDPEFLAPKKGKGDALGKAREAWLAGRRKEGARRVLAIGARAGFGLDAIDPNSPHAVGLDRWKEELGLELADVDRQFLVEVAAFCRDENIRAPEGDAGALVNAFQKGLPPGHALVIAATEVDAKGPLLKLAQEKGVVIARKIEAKLKDLDLSELVPTVLKPLGKRLGPGAEELLKDRCGANMRLLRSELEKLALYADGPTIRAEDVELLVSRTRDEEYLELSDAVQRRDLRAALRYLDDALGSGSHPLLILGTLAGMMRNLLEGRERLTAWVRGPFRMSFNEFKSSLFPRIEQEAKANKARVPHPFAAYSSLQAAARYRDRELPSLLQACADADLAIKSSGNGRLILERLLWQVCGATGR
jgi:DNA polymerase-3 subunit delta